MYECLAGQNGMFLVELRKYQLLKKEVTVQI
jgi:hypothetical protein